MAADSSPVNLIIASGIIVTASTVIRDVHEGKPRAAPIVFGFMMVAGLLIIALGSPRTARGLAWFSLVGAFVINGPAVFLITSGVAKSRPPGLVTSVKKPKQPPVTNV